MTRTQWVRLQDAAHLFVGLSAVRKGAGDDASAVRLVSTGDITDGEVPPLDALPMAEVGVSPESFRILEGDVLITARGTQAKSALVGVRSQGAVANSTLMVIRPNGALHQEVMYAIVRGASFQRHLSRIARGSTSSFGLSLGDVAEIRIPVPPSSEQDQMAPLLAGARRHYALALAAAEQRRRIFEAATELWLYPPNLPPSGGTRT